MHTRVRPTTKAPSAKAAKAPAAKAKAVGAPVAKAGKAPSLPRPGTGPATPSRPAFTPFGRTAPVLSISQSDIELLREEPKSLKMVVSASKLLGHE